MNASTLVTALAAALVAGAVVGVVVRLQLVRAASSPPTASTVGAELLGQHRLEVRHQLDRVADLLMSLQERQAEQHGEVAAKLGDAARATAGLAATTQQLRDALGNPKARGQWGERMADDVLRLAGFVEGISYRKQTALPGGTIPDVTFLLPGDLLLNMDVKFPVDNYVRALDARTPAERTAAEQAFTRDVRNRVKELAGRGYVQPGLTVDHVLLFIPNEAVYGFIHERDPSLADLALRQKVVLCSPFTLFAVLGVIRHAIDAFRVTRASDDILACLGAFADQWERFAEQLDLVARRFDTVHRGFEDLAGPRRRQLERQLDRLDDLRPHHDDHAAEVAVPPLAPVERAG
ncbi:MAG: recombination protein RmuC [Acidimicrobiales bacterium]|nr:recombination protein RmuC [Acidimicrobiales bacterium]